MITVNLLPHELRPIKRTPLPYVASGLIAVVVLFVISAIWLGNETNVRQAKRVLDDHRDQLAELQSTVTKYNELNAEKGRLAEQVNAIGEIASDRIIWSRQLFNLTRLALKNMWYESVKVGIKSSSEMRPVMNAKTNKLEMKKITIQRQVLTVTGYVMPGEDGRSSVSPFMIATEADPEFSCMFQLDDTSFSDTTFEDISVRAFTLEYVVTGQHCTEEGLAIDDEEEEG